MPNPDVGAACVLRGRHDYQPNLFLWKATGKVGLPRWYCRDCGAERPPLTDRERMENLAAALAEP